MRRPPHKTLPFRADPAQNAPVMQIHGSCAAHDGAGVLLVGAPGTGKSDLLLRLLDRGFTLVADDQVILEAGRARAPASLAGLVEVRGIGIIRLPYAADAALALTVELGNSDRMPEPRQRHGVPLLCIDPAQASAPARVALALRCLRGDATLVAGALS